MTEKTIRLDWLAEVILEIWANSGRAAANPSYLADKREIFIGKSRDEMMREIQMLDGATKEALAKRLQVSVEDLRAFVRVLNCF